MWVRIVGLVGVFALLAVASTSCEPPEGVPFACECGAAPRCGDSCKSTCGCCSIGPAMCVPEGIMRTDQARNCYYDVMPCSAPGRCVVGSMGPVCAESAGDCETVRSAYEAELQRTQMITVRTGQAPLPSGPYRSTSCPEACQASAGHCAQGLDTCWFLSFGPDDELGRLATLYQALRCPALGPCVCPPAPVATCEYDSSGAAGAFRGPLTCMVE
jgi:hypothetical protein